MALTWNWNEKCGEAVFRQESGKEHITNLYQGNALLIMIDKWEEEGTKKYCVSGFFLDEQHMKKCLGLNKKEGYTKNMYDQEYYKLTEIKINKAKYSYTEKLVKALTQAFDNITIKIVSE